MTMIVLPKAPTPWWKWLLGAAVIAIPSLLGVGLIRDPSYIPSMMIGRAMPRFQLPAFGGEGEITTSQFIGKPLVLNFWASWCASCRLEHPLLVELGGRAIQGRFSLIGVNYRDAPDQARQFLERTGRFPYPSIIDERGRLGIDFGVYGMPETFFIDAGGVVRARHIGPLTKEALSTNLALIGTYP